MSTVIYMDGLAHKCHRWILTMTRDEFRKRRSLIPSLPDFELRVTLTRDVPLPQGPVDIEFGEFSAQWYVDSRSPRVFRAVAAGPITRKRRRRKHDPR